MSKKSTFKKPPLSAIEKAKKENDFLTFNQNEPLPEPARKERPKGKEPVKRLYIRVPESMHEELNEIVNLTGISMNAVCLELLRPTVKRKLRELKEDL